ncbi:MAG: aminoglycoside phosphotransferase family protein [Desulfatiglandales bacterium]
MRTELKKFVSEFLQGLGLSGPQSEWESVPADGSKRLFWRIRSQPCGARYMVMENAPLDLFSKKENLAYLKIGRHLHGKGVPVPEIYRHDLEKGWFIMTDLGETSLQSWASRHSDRAPFYEQAIEILFRLQTRGAQGFHTRWTCQTARYDREVMRRYEANYFRDAFLNNYLGLKKEWPELERPFDHLAEEASRANGCYYLHRDFQSRNLIIDGDRIGIIDWQGGRLGPLGYDLASLLIDPYVHLNREERNRFLNHYVQLLGTDDPQEAANFRQCYPYLAIQRNLQILGAFSFLTRVQGKLHFEVYIQPALLSLQQLLDELDDPGLNILKNLSDSLVNR